MAQRFHAGRRGSSFFLFPRNGRRLSWFTRNDHVSLVVWGTCMLRKPNHVDSRALEYDHLCSWGGGEPKSPNQFFHDFPAVKWKSTKQRRVPASTATILMDGGACIGSSRGPRLIHHLTLQRSRLIGRLIIDEAGPRTNQSYLSY